MKKSVKSVALLLCVVTALSLGGCVTPKTWAVKVGEHTISAGMYSYLLQIEKSTYLSQNSLTDSEEIWEEEYDDGMTIGDYIADNTMNTLVNSATWRAQFDKLGLAFTKEEKEMIQSEIDAMLENSGGKKKVQATLEDYNIDYDEYLQYVFYDSQKIIKVVDYYYGSDGKEPVSDKVIKDYFLDNYVRCKHILISTRDEEGNDYDAARLAEIKASAQDVFEKAKTADETAFDKLIKEYNEDEGVASYPDGYMFTTGEMVSEFEDASFDMQVGETRLVQTEYGYHIIRKLTLESEEFFTQEIRQKMLMNLKAAELEQLFAQWQLDMSPKINERVKKKYTCANVGFDQQNLETEQMAQISEQMAQNN